MYRKIKADKTNLKVNDTYLGESIEQKIRRIVNNKEPISDGAPLIYTERKDGVMPEYNIKTDRWEVAIDAMDAVSKSHKAKRENKPTIGEEAKKGMELENKGKKDGGAEPIQATDKK